MFGIRSSEYSVFNERHSLMILNKIFFHSKKKKKKKKK